MADWRSASADMRSLGIDEYLAALNVLVDEARRPGRSCRALPGRLVIPGLCGTIPGQGTQARHGRCTDDLAAQQSGLSAVAEATPLSVFQGLVSSGNGLVVGRNIANSGETRPTPTISAKSCRLLTRSARRNSRGSKPSSRTGTPGRSTFPANTISKLSRNYTSATNSPRKPRRPRAKDRPLAAPASDLCSCRERRHVVAPEQVLAVHDLWGRGRHCFAARSRRAII